LRAQQGGRDEEGEKGDAGHPVVHRDLFSGTCLDRIEFYHLPTGFVNLSRQSA
jgi:hypothetical protein